jgi:5-methylcytosine-specific restriction protein B
MTKVTRLDLEKTYAAILQAARARRFISYGDLAAASGVPWPLARRLIPQHLGQLVTLAHERGWPMPSAIVVNKDDVATGRLEGSAREGFLAAARDAGFDVADPEQFVKDQQEKIFAWAPTAPDTLGLTQLEHTSSGVSGPRFVQYFAPVLNALRDVGGEDRPKNICAWIIKSTDAQYDLRPSPSRLVPASDLPTMRPSARNTPDLG